MLIAFCCISFVLIYVDVLFYRKGWIDSLSNFYPSKPEGARALLSTVAGSMITVAGALIGLVLRYAGLPRESSPRITFTIRKTNSA